jgi:hypothetical protein
MLPSAKKTDPSKERSRTAAKYVRGGRVGSRVRGGGGGKRRGCASNADRKTQGGAKTTTAPPANNVLCPANTLADHTRPAKHQPPSPPPSVWHPKHAHGAVVGTCESICPPGEAAERLEHNELRLYERTHGAVKRFRRSAAGRNQFEPFELRPPIVLQQTMAHLESLLQQSHFTQTRSDFFELYLFISDRFQAIRQDFVVQNVTFGDIYIEALEKQTRFHIVTFALIHDGCHRDKFDAKLACEQLMQCISPLKACLCEHGCRFANNHRGRAGDILGAWLLLNLGQHTLAQLLATLPTWVLTEHQQPRRSSSIGDDIFESESGLVLALKLAMFWQSRDFASFLRLAEPSPYGTDSNIPLSPLLRSVCIRYVTMARVQVLAAFDSALMKNQQVAIADISRVLRLSSTTVVKTLCRACGLGVVAGSTSERKTCDSSDKITFRCARDFEGKSVINGSVNNNQNDASASASTKQQQPHYSYDENGEQNALVWRPPRVNAFGAAAVVGSSDIVKALSFGVEIQPPLPLTDCDITESLGGMSLTTKDAWDD